MTDLTTAQAKKIAAAAGYYIREGSYHGTTDDRIGRWYVGHDDDAFFRPFGLGHRTRGDAWRAAVDSLREDQMQREWDKAALLAEQGFLRAAGRS